MPITIDQTTFAVGSGSLSALVAGPTDSPCIVLLHGIPASAELFRGVMPTLAEAGYRVIAPHMPGYGATRRADHADYSLSAVADWYAAWLEQEHLAPVWLVGHDLGGAVAQMMVVRYPHLISHLSLGDTVAGGSFPVFAVKTLIWAAQTGVYPTIAALRLIPNPYVSWQLRRAFGDASKLTADLLQRVFWDGKLRTAQGRHEFAKHLKQLRNNESIEAAPQLKGATMPTLLLWGASDRFQSVESSGKGLQRLLPDGTPLEIIEGAGHFLPLEKPEAYAQALLDWRQGLNNN